LVLAGAVAAPAGDESREPPLLFSVSVGAVTVPATEGEAVSVAGTFQDPRVTVRPEPHRLFPYGGVSFHYPRGFTFEADLDDPAAIVHSIHGFGFHDGQARPVPLAQVAGFKNLVPMDHPWVRTARQVGMHLGVGDAELRKLIARSPRS
jgi:hypothetical protein